MKLALFAFILPLLPGAVSWGAHVHKGACHGNLAPSDACCDKDKTSMYTIYKHSTEKCQSRPAKTVLDYDDKCTVG